MYDWPAHAEPVNHIPILRVYDICQTRERIRTNNRAIDELESGCDGRRFRNDVGDSRRFVGERPVKLVRGHV